MESTLTIRRVSLDSLELDPGNARTHDEKNLAAITDSLTRNALAEILRTLQVEDALDGIGFSDAEIDALVASLDAGNLDVTQDEVPEPAEAAVTRPGDLWTLGSHRLLCGDSAKWEDVERLLAGARQGQEGPGVAPHQRLFWGPCSAHSPAVGAGLLRFLHDILSHPDHGP